MNQRLFVCIQLNAYTYDLLVNKFIDNPIFK